MGMLLLILKFACRFGEI